MDEVVNIAGYRFVDLPDCYRMRDPLLDFCLENKLKGSILLSMNGINFFLSGSDEAIEKFRSRLELDPRLSGIPMKYSYTEYQPFRRMLVKVKKEIISLGMDDIRPSEFTGQHVSPIEFKSMLDKDKEIIVLDTRNNYETRIGSFKGAVELDLKSFRGFPEAIRNLPASYKKKTLVLYCTGGIRCEKATSVMLKDGYEDVRQLDGGILAYLEQCGGSHWEGDCFVFDQRVAVDENLNESEIEMCFSCREPLSVEEQKSENYAFGKYCPYCYTGHE